MRVTVGNYQMKPAVYYTHLGWFNSSLCIMHAPGVTFTRYDFVPTHFSSQVFIPIPKGLVSCFQKNR